MSKEELSPSGAPIYRHEARDRELELATGDSAAAEAITAHIEKHIGPVRHVFSEIISDLVRVNILVVEPSAKRNYYTLVTCGMSDRPMTVPEGAEQFRFAELMLCLPPTWKLSDEAFRSEDNYWPIRAMKVLARLPHEYETWLYHAHTIPNANPPEPYAVNTKLSGMMLSLPTIADDLEAFFTLQLGEDKPVHFFTLLPLYEEEMNFKLSKGADALLEKLAQADVNELVDPRRKNVCKKKLFGLF
ncbi:hypothetical protein FHS18_005946 [Paenibacillus phyllosphaerae]|uniref:Suppressor of fused-like domain-containing protein n=1 Tax=Paenibacillus phyllosphaerae TaxID=274593 RepID=A0A7W5FR00_9BACL|nr:suppressor of fused domain protein [Paenibacillus phyllosphaerae]MBB3113833.1 hypothetical protein [Paenibacillus phyllosphaerae]